MDPKSIPAFPTDNEQQNGPSSYHYEGMSLRDWFATHAKPALDSDGDVSMYRATLVMGGKCPAAEDGESDDAYKLRNLIWWIDAEARVRYMHADAMLRARATPPQSPSASGNVGEEK